MSKVLQVSDDSGVTWHSLPGNSAEFNVNGSSLEDTVLGQTFASSQPGIIDWDMSAPAYLKGFAGYVATFKKTGTSTAVTGEAMELDSGDTYVITDSTKSVWDYNNTITVYENAVAVDEANIASVDHLFGKVTFEAAYTVTGPITVDVNYLPLAAVGTANEFSLTQNADAILTTDLATAQTNGGYNTYTQGLRTVSIDASGFFNSSNDFKTLVANRGEMVVEINPDGNNDSVCRGFFHAITTGQSGDVGGTEDESITFELSVPASSSTTTENVTVPFNWNHTSTSTIPTAIKKVLEAWEDESDIDAQYLHDGTNGWKGTAVVTDVSLSGGVEAMNEFSVALTGSGAYSSVPA